MDVTVLCRVVDNFGDIGVVYRLCRSLCEKDSSVKIRLVVDDLDSFSKICPSIDPGLSCQEYMGWRIFRSGDRDACFREFSENLPLMILECFQCGRPEWLEDILFAPGFDRTVRIVNVEYLTAEDWAEGFHLMNSATRSAFVKKVNFFPGFTKKTGGLIMDMNFRSCMESSEFALECLSSAGSSGKYNDILKVLSAPDEFKVMLFSYPKNFEFLRKALNSFSEERHVTVFVAQGAGRDSAVSCLSSGDRKFSLVELPYMEQEKWDALLCLMDFLFVRGEDSFARCALLGKPFVWNIYPQDEQYHLVKLDAFLKKLAVPQMDDFSFCYNFSDEEPGSEALDVISGRNMKADMEGEILGILRNSDVLEKSFGAFARELRNNDLTENLLEFLCQ